MTEEEYEYRDTLMHYVRVRGGKDHAFARYLCRICYRMSEQGDPEAYYFIGKTYYWAGDWDEAARWYRKAAEHWHLGPEMGDYPGHHKEIGIAELQSEIQRCENKDKGSRITPFPYILNERRLPYILNERRQRMLRDPHLTVHAAEEGETYAQTRLGRIYERGQAYELGQPPDQLQMYEEPAAEILRSERARAQLEKAIFERNNPHELRAPESPAALGKLVEERARARLHRERFGLAGPPAPIRRSQVRDYGEAVKWYRRAAKKGDPSAQNCLGVMYGTGHGVPRNYVQALMWWNLAATHSGIGDALHLGAHKWREIVAKRMTPAQIAEAQRLAQEWITTRKKKMERLFEGLRGGPPTLLPLPLRPPELRPSDADEFHRIFKPERPDPMIEQLEIRKKMAVELEEIREKMAENDEKLGKLAKIQEKRALAQDDLDRISARCRGNVLKAELRDDEASAAYGWARQRAAERRLEDLVEAERQAAAELEKAAPLSKVALARLAIRRAELERILSVDVGAQLPLKRGP